MALKVLQINLNHCEAAQDLLTKTVREEKVDVAIIADQYRNLTDLPGRPMRQAQQPSGPVANTPSIRSWKTLKIPS